VFNKDVPHGKIVETLLKTQQLEMEPEFPVPIPWIVLLTAGPIFTAILDYELLKMGC